MGTGAGDGTVKYWDMRMLSKDGPAGAFEEPEVKAAKRASTAVASMATATEGGRSHGVTCLSLSPQGESVHRLSRHLEKGQHLKRAHAGSSEALSCCMISKSALLTVCQNQGGLSGDE